MKYKRCLASVEGNNLSKEEQDEEIFDQNDCGK